MKTMNINRLNYSIKRFRLAECLKTRHNDMQLKKKPSSLIKIHIGRE
jgi:hypothetical protein